ncbi:TlpA family protein disulfide reductase [Puniceicoccaceae bacterium K14]|nr:TlpA family protein disulfide reductase [Puniceicoccaceae bacterium K14]
MSQIRLLLIVLSLSLLSSLSSASEEFSVGAKLPPLDGYELTGELPDIEGKVVLIDFWASWCAPCKASFPSMDEIYTVHKDQGFEIIAVSVDKKQALVDRFTQKLSPSFSIVWDGKQSLVSAAKVSVMPTSLLIDKKGYIRYIHIGWHGNKSIKQLEVELVELLEEDV